MNTLENPHFLDIIRKRFPADEGIIPHELGDFLHEFGNVPAAILHAILFVPQYIEVEGSVLMNVWAVDLVSRFIEAKTRRNCNLAEVEASFNTVEIPYLFSDRQSSEEEDVQLAELMAEAWRGRLVLLYPQRTFAVAVLPADDNGQAVRITFHEVRPQR